jgi:hypothetical protein
MKTSLSVSSVVLALLAFSSRGGAADGTIITVEGPNPVKVKVGDVIRVAGSVPAGGAIEEKLTGPGTIQSANVVRRFKNGKPVIGLTVKEFTIKANKPGTIKITITSRAPAAGTEPKVEKYEIEVVEE